MKDYLLWRKMARITAILAKRMGTVPEEALALLYGTETCARLHSPEYGLQTMSDAYIADEIMSKNKDKTTIN